MVARVEKRFVMASFEEALGVVRGGPPVSAFMGVPTGAELLAIYNHGYQGVSPNSTTPEIKAAYKTMMAAMPKLYDIFPWARGIGKGKVSVPYAAAMALILGWGGLFAQVQGDCTVHGNEHSAEVDYCNDCMWGETVFKGPIAFENVYRSRGFSGDGWSCEAPAVYVGPDGRGGFLYRKVYEGPNGEKVDLTNYNSSWQSNGRAGVPAWLEEISRQNKVKWIIPITTMEEYRDATALGFGINFCSGQAWSSETDENGVAVAKGSWSHAMAHTACIDTPWAEQKYGGMLGCVQNSWGKSWNRINGKPEGAPSLAPGSFYSRASSIAKLLDGDQFALCSVWGWDRITWEAFDPVGMAQHLRNSTTQDYYKTRQEKMHEYGLKILEEGFLAV